MKIVFENGEVCNIPNSVVNSLYLDAIEKETLCFSTWDNDKLRICKKLTAKESILCLRESGICQLRLDGYDCQRLIDRLDGRQDIASCVIEDADDPEQTYYVFWPCDNPNDNDKQRIFVDSDRFYIHIGSDKKWKKFKEIYVV